MRLLSRVLPSLEFGGAEEAAAPALPCSFQPSSELQKCCFSLGWRIIQGAHSNEYLKWQEHIFKYVNGGSAIFELGEGLANSLFSWASFSIQPNRVSLALLARQGLEKIHQGAPKSLKLPFPRRPNLRWNHYRTEWPLPVPCGLVKIRKMDGTQGNGESWKICLDFCKEHWRKRVSTPLSKHAE